MIKVDPEAIYNEKDLMELFDRSSRTIAYYHKSGLPKTKIRGKNYTFGHEVIEWFKNGGLETSKKPAANPKLLKFKQGCM